MKRKKVILLIALVVTVSFFTSCAPDTHKLTGDKIVKKSSENLIVQGNIEAKEININSKTPGKIKEIKIKEGETVKQGQVLAVIDNTTLQAKQSQSQAQIEAATAQMKDAQSAKQAVQAQLEKAQNGARPEEVAQAKANFDLAQVTCDRVKALYDQSYVAKADLDNAQNKFELAKQQYEIVKSGARAEDIAALQAQVGSVDAKIQAAQGLIKQAEGGLSEVQSYIEDTTITAPADGVITQLNVEVGELVSTGMPILVITNTVTPWVECNVKETDLSKVKLNSEVSVKLSAYPKEKFKGKIVRINEKPDFAVKRATNDNGEFDVLSYGAKVELTNINKQLHPGMTAIVDFGK